MHHTPEGRYYFDRQENLTKLLQSLAHDAPAESVDDLIATACARCSSRPARPSTKRFSPCRALDDVADRVAQGRILLIVSPDSKIPPEEVQNFFEGLSQKNNLCVLTGDKTAMASVEKAARQLYRGPESRWAHPQGPPSARGPRPQAADLRAGFQLHGPQPLRQGPFSRSSAPASRRSCAQSRST